MGAAYTITNNMSVYMIIEYIPVSVLSDRICKQLYTGMKLAARARVDHTMDMDTCTHLEVVTGATALATAMHSRSAPSIYQTAYGYTILSYMILKQSRIKCHMQ